MNVRLKAYVTKNWSEKENIHEKSQWTQTRIQQDYEDILDNCFHILDQGCMRF